MHQLNGLLLIDKPDGLTSHDVVARVRRILGLRAVGHAGTLDPIASGLLVLLLGEGTKISDYVLNGDKAYEVTVRLGVTTDTLDRAGKTLEEKPVSVTEDQVRDAVKKLTGVLQLQVPAHSAVKIDGKKLYEYARKDQEIELPIREMDFRTTNLSRIELPLVTVSMSCSKGSYVRAWASKLGEILGCGGHVQELRRTVSEPYRVEQAIGLEVLEELWKNSAARDGSILGPAWIPLKDTIPSFRTLRVDGREEVLMRNGQIANKLQTQLLSLVPVTGVAPGVKVISSDTDDMVALLVPEPGQFFRIKRVFHRV